MSILTLRNGGWLIAFGVVAATFLCLARSGATPTTSSAATEEVQKASLGHCAVRSHRASELETAVNRLVAERYEVKAMAYDGSNPSYFVVVLCR